MIKTDGIWFKDEHGRTLMLRGVNLGGSSKVPYKPNGATWNRQGFFQHRDVSFVGRPFPLDEADEHLARLQEWGLTFVRFLITWEAIEHAGPGVYDQEYLDYVYEVLKKAGAHGIEVFIDPHQDVWSRFSGGDGAPGWTFEAVGMDVAKFATTGAAITHQEHGDPFPRMIWPANYGKLANLTLWTLFFGGDDFAPETTVDGAPVQEYLQGHYIEAIKQVALRLRDLPNVAGFDTLNEPSAGLIGVADLNSHVGPLKLGQAPTAFQAMLLGAGYPQEVGVWEIGLSGVKQTGTRLLNPDGVSLWLEGYEPLWRQNGVWGFTCPGGQCQGSETGEPELLRPAHFEADFYGDYFRPFANRYARAMRSIMPEAIIFVEGVPGQGHVTWTPSDAPNVVHAAHWYDDLTLFTKNFRSWMTFDMSSQQLVVFGPGQARKAFVGQIARLMEISETHMNNAPTLIGEVGIPFDMQDKQAYRTGDFSLQVRALDATMQALEKNLVSFTLWNYTADNTNERGDQWNDEDLSLFSRDQQTGTGDLYDGGRALEAALRPFARKVAGKPLSMSFDLKRRVFQFEFQHQAGVTAPTELFVPNYQYPFGYGVSISDGEYEIDRQTQTLIYRHGQAQAQHRITLWDKRLGSLEQVQMTARREQQTRGLVVVGAIAAVLVLFWLLFRRRR